MLRYDKKGVFVVRMVNKKWKFYDEIYLSLFKECDKIMKKEHKYLTIKENYSEKTKGRFRANMKRLEDSKYIKKIKEVRVGCNSVKEVYYKILGQDTTEENEEPSVNKYEERASDVKEVEVPIRETQNLSTHTDNNNNPLQLNDSLKNYDEKNSEIFSDINSNSINENYFKYDEQDDDLNPENIFSELKEY